MEFKETTELKNEVLMQLQGKGMLSEREMIRIFVSKGHAIDKYLVEWIRSLPYNYFVQCTPLVNENGKVYDYLYEVIEGCSVI